MWANRTRRGKKQIEDDRGMNIIEVNHPEEGMMVYTPSSSVMPARPLGAPLEVPIIAPVVKKEIEEDEAETVSSHFSVLDPVTESTFRKTTQMIDFPNANAPTDDNVPKVKIKTEPLDVSDGNVSILFNDNVESSRVNEKNTTELNQKSIDPHESAEDESLEERPCGQNSLEMWDLQRMFADELSKNTEDQLSFESQPFKKTYLHFCLELNKTDVEECIGYLNSAFRSIKKNPLFSLEVPSQKNTSTAEYSTSEETNFAVKSDISTEELKKILAVSNLPSIAPDLPGQSNSHLFQSNAPHPQTSSSVLKEIVKKEPVSPERKPYNHLVDAGKGNVSIKSRSVDSNVQPASQLVSSKIVPEVSVTPKESAKKRKNSDDIEPDWTKVAIKKERISPEKNFNNNGETSKRNNFDIDVNAAKKHIKKEIVPVDNSASVRSVGKTGPASFNVNTVDKSVISKVIEVSCFEETHNVVTPKQSVQEKKILDSSSSFPVTKDIPSLIRQSDSTTSVRPIPELNRFSHVDLNVTKKHNEKEVNVSVENFAGIGRVENAPAINTNLDLSPRIAKMERQISSVLNCSPSKSKTTQEDNRMDISCVPFLPTIKVTPSATCQSDSTTRRIPVADRFLTPQIPTMIQSQYSHLEETPCYEAPQKKRKLTPEEYRRKYSNSASSNLNISKCSSPQASLINNFNQMPRTDHSLSFPRDPRLQKSVPSTESILPTSRDIPLNEMGQNVYTSNSSRSQTSFSSVLPISRERLSSQEFQEPIYAHQISQCDSRSQNVFEPLRGNNSSVGRKIGREYIDPNDVTGLILEWNVSWLEQQKKNKVVPPIINRPSPNDPQGTFSYPEVKNTYDKVLSYYNTYLPLHLLNIWMSMYKSWERQDFLPNSFLEKIEERSYVRIRCLIILNAADLKKLPKTEDLLICHVDGHPKKLFGKVVKVHVDKHSSLLRTLEDVKAYIDVICAENFDVSSGRPITLQKLNNIRIALNVCNALKSLEYINEPMRSAILNPKDQGSRIKVIDAKPFIACSLNKINIQQIMSSAKSRSQSITLVHTKKPSDSLRAITLIVPEVVELGGLLFLCMKEEETFFAMADDLRKFKPVLAVKEEEVPRLPRDLAQFTIKNRLEDLQECHVVITLMSAMFIGELKTRLLKDSRDSAMCLIHEAQYFLETESALLLEHNFKKLILLGRDGFVNDVEPRLQRQSFHKSLFLRISESTQKT